MRQQEVERSYYNKKEDEMEGVKEQGCWSLVVGQFEAIISGGLPPLCFI